MNPQSVQAFNTTLFKRRLLQSRLSSDASETPSLTPKEQWQGTYLEEEETLSRTRLVCVCVRVCGGGLLLLMFQVDVQVRSRGAGR